MMGRLPKRQDTQIADVLARLLNGQRITALDALRESSAFRLAAIIHKLRHSYGWAGIETTDVSVECADGHAAQVAEYGLPAPVAVAARSRNEVASWMSDVLSCRGASGRAV